MLWVKSSASRAFATRPLEDIPPSTPCFGKTAESLTSGTLEPSGGTRRQQSINGEMSSGLLETQRLLKATSYTLSCGRGKMASDISNLCSDVHQNMWTVRPTVLTKPARWSVSHATQTVLIVVQLFGTTATYRQTSTNSKAASLLGSKAPRT